MSNKHLYNVYVCLCTSAQNTCSKMHATLTANKMHIHIYTGIRRYAYVYICTQARRRIDDTAHNASLLKLTIYAQICIHIHIHMYIHAYMYIYMYTCIYIHIYLFVQIHTYIYIHTHIRHVRTHTRKHAWNDGVAATVREARLAACPSPCPLQSGRESPSVASSPIARSRGTMDTRTNRSSSHHHDSAPPRLHPLICTGAEPIHPFHGCSSRGPRRSIHIPAVFLPFSCHFPAVFIGRLLTNMGLFCRI